MLQIGWAHRINNCLQRLPSVERTLHALSDRRGYVKSTLDLAAVSDLEHQDH